MNHTHSFETILREVLKGGGIKLTKECACGKRIIKEGRLL